MAEERDQASVDAQTIGEKIMDIADGYSRLAVMGALSVLVAMMAEQAEKEGVRVEVFLGSFLNVVNKLIVQQREELAKLRSSLQ